ncbi:MAG: hypothetical protein AB8B89_00785 [Gammaproteobacteria bacterium]
MKIIFTLCLLCCLCTATIADDNAAVTRSITLISSSDFTLANDDTSTLTIKPLKEKLRSIENLKNTEAVGITYLGILTLSESATPLSVLREISVQISNGLDIDLALITDSTTSQSLQPNEMLLLYHPQLVITLALTKLENSEQYTLVATYAIPVDSSKNIEIENQPE